jgi:hypothetical protein
LQVHRDTRQTWSACNAVSSRSMICLTGSILTESLIVDEAPQVFDIYIDRSYQAYLAKWFRESSSIYRSYLGDPRASFNV